MECAGTASIPLVFRVIRIEINRYGILRCVDYWIVDMIVELGQEGTTHSHAHKIPIYSGYFIAFGRSQTKGNHR